MFGLIDTSFVLHHHRWKGIVHLSILYNHSTHLMIMEVFDWHLVLNHRILEPAINVVFFSSRM